MTLAVDIAVFLALACGPLSVMALISRAGDFIPPMLAGSISGLAAACSIIA